MTGSSAASYESAFRRSWWLYLLLGCLRGRLSPLASHEPISTQTHGDDRKTSAREWTRDAVDTAVFPISQTSALIDPVIGRKTGLIENISNGCTERSRHNQREERFQGYLRRSLSVSRPYQSFPTLPKFPDPTESLDSTRPICRATRTRVAPVSRFPFLAWNSSNSPLKNLEIGAFPVFLSWGLGRSGCCEQTSTYAASSLGMRIRL